MRKLGTGKDMEKTVFITGATGNIGGKIVIKILRDNPRTRLIILVRGKDEKEGRQRLFLNLRILDPELNPEQYQGRIRIIAGDITADNLGLSGDVQSEIAGEITHIIHSAAATQFNLPLVCARQINLYGTQQVMSFAKNIRRKGNLRHVSYISTAFVGGDKKGIIGEDEVLFPGEFANSYEQTKWEAEKYVRSLMPDLPVTIFRPSIVVGDSQTGRTLSFNVMYGPLHYIYRGVLRILPCHPDTGLDVIPLDYAADAINFILFHTEGTAGKTYNIVAGGKAEPVGAIVAEAVRIFGIDHNIHFVSPTLYRAARHLLYGRYRRMAQLFKIYEPYLSGRRVFDDSNTRAALHGSGINFPSLQSYLGNILTFCLVVEWGRKRRQVG
jgi:nucleoside-diphosphate-sugar epimerase